MVYVDTRRPFWNMELTAGKFAGTALLLGAALATVTWAWNGNPAARAAAFAAWGLRLALSGWEAWKYRAALRDPASPWHRSAQIMQRLQTRLLRARFILLLLTGGVLPVSALLFPAAAPALLTFALLATAASQLIERHQFFTAAAGPVMPGVPRHLSPRCETAP
jgi:formate dehydrogenase iron-sulfur subunit